MIVQHISHITFEKTIINRLVAYFKVDKKENVWFLWSTSIRIKETSKIHRQTSSYLDKPVTLEPMIKTNENIRLAQTYLANRPAHLQMNESCNICGKCVTNGQLVPVQYKYLLGNDEILRRSEKYYTKHGDFIDHNRPKNADEMIMMDDIPEEGRPIQIKKALIGIPVFIKAFHPELNLKEYQILREKEHFLMQKTNVCDECFLVVSKKYQGGYPYRFTVQSAPPKVAPIPVQKYLHESSLEPVFRVSIPL
jgi:hypothetical protein